jgi:hypothetical protein
MFNLLFKFYFNEYLLYLKKNKILIRPSIHNKSKFRKKHSEILFLLKKLIIKFLLK